MAATPGSPTGSLAAPRFPIKTDEINGMPKLSRSSPRENAITRRPLASRISCECGSETLRGGPACGIPDAITRSPPCIRSSSASPERTCAQRRSERFRRRPHCSARCRRSRRCAEPRTTAERTIVCAISLYVGVRARSPNRAELWLSRAPRLRRAAPYRRDLLFDHASIRENSTPFAAIARIENTPGSSFQSAPAQTLVATWCSYTSER